MLMESGAVRSLRVGGCFFHYRVRAWPMARRWFIRVVAPVGLNGFRVRGFRV